MERKLNLVSLGFAAVVLTVPAIAAAAVLQPDETASKDVFVYQGIPRFRSKRPPLVPADSRGRLTGSGHDLRTYIGFDLSGVPFTAAQVTQAKLHLRVVDGTAVGFPFGNPERPTPSVSPPTRSILPGPKQAPHGTCSQVWEVCWTLSRWTASISGCRLT